MTSFYKLSGGGNDFIALVEPDRAPSADAIRRWCHRGLSVGADGLFVLRRDGDGAAMSHFNADGGPAELCVNGTRCAARLAFHLGWAREEIVIATGAGAATARRNGSSGISLEVPPPGEPQAVEVEIDGRPIGGWRVEVGVPHFVLLRDESLEAAPVAELGPRLRAHQAFAPAGANIDFVRLPAPRRLEIRTWERGVEAETLACGSGVLAAAATGFALGRLELPASALTRGGFTFEVDGPRQTGDAAPWRLAGDARLLAHGSILPDAESLPSPAVWT